MNVFFDTEFTGLHQNTTLISIACITENNTGFYAELTDCGHTDDPWVQENVIEHLLWNNREPQVWQTGHLHCVKGTRAHVGHELSEWLVRLGQPVEMWSDVYAYDWVLFHTLMGGAFHLPENVYYIPFDIATAMKVKGVDPDINREAFSGLTTAMLSPEYDWLKAPKHNAIWDALVIRACYMRLQQLK